MISGCVLTPLQSFEYAHRSMQNGITYIAQVLKRNRTLKVLNLSENKLDVQGLVAIAEALVCYANQSLTTSVLISPILLRNITHAWRR